MTVSGPDLIKKFLLSQENYRENSGALVPAGMQNLDSMGILRLFFLDGALAETCDLPLARGRAKETQRGMRKSEWISSTNERPNLGLPRVTVAR